MAHSGREIVVVDIESSGLRDVDIPVEVAWRNVHTGESGTFIPPHSVAWVLDRGEPKALEVNGYRERIAGAAQDDGTGALRLFRALAGNAVFGSNPRQDAEWLECLFSELVERAIVETVADTTKSRPYQPWHHRMPDLASVAAVALGLPLSDLPGLHRVCQLLGVDPEPDVHTAANGVAKTVECLQVLVDEYGVKL